jgi:hypothetical protein
VQAFPSRPETLARDPGAAQDLFVLSRSALPDHDRRSIFERAIDRVGSFLESDEGRAALLRSGAATMQGGLGAGIQAGAQFMDQRRAAAEDARRFGINAELAERGVANQEFTSQSNAALGVANIDQRERESVRDDRTRRYQTNTSRDVALSAQAIQARGQDIEAEIARLRDLTERYGIDTRVAIAQLEEAGRTDRHNRPSGDTVYTQDAQTVREATRPTVGVGSRNQGTRRVRRETTDGDSTTTVEIEYPQGGEQAPQQGGAVRVSTPEEAQRLPRGTVFIGPDNIPRIRQ